MDEQNTVTAENSSVAEDSNASSLPLDQSQTSDDSQSQETEGQSPPAGETGDETQGDDDTSERKPSRAERVIRKKDAELKKKEAELVALHQKVQQFEGYNQPFPGLQQPPQLDIQPGQEILPEEYQQHVAQAAQSYALPQIEQLRNEFETKEAQANFESDKAVLENEPELNDASPDYIPELEQAISEEFQEKAFKVVGFNPVTGEPIRKIDRSVRLAEIAKRHLNVARAAAKRTSAEMKNAVAKQADEASPKPSGEIQADKPFEDLSIEEMEKKLGIVTQ